MSSKASASSTEIVKADKAAIDSINKKFERGREKVLQIQKPLIKVTLVPD